MVGPTSHKNSWVAVFFLSLATSLLALVVLVVVRPPFFTTLVIVGGTGMVGVAVLGTSIALLLEPRRRAERTLLRLGGVLALVAVVSGLLLTFFVGTAALVVTVALLGLLGFQFGLPLLVGTAVADLRKVPIRHVILAWPASLTLGWLVFVLPAPGGPNPLRYNATVLAEPARTLALAFVAAITVFGPAALASLVWGRRKRGL